MPKHDNLATALAAFQAELPSLRKDETAKVKGETNDGRPVNYTYGYADLAQVVEAVSTCLGQHGMAFTAWPTIEGNAFVLKYSLLHEAGEERTGVWPLPDPNRTKPQQVGSAITYARRYAQMAVTNTFPDKEDDDGAAAVPAGHRDQAMAPEDFDKLPRERPTTGQAHDQHRRGASADRPVSGPPAGPVKTSWTDEEVTGYHGKLDSLELDKVGAVYDWMAGKGLHDRPINFGSDIPPVTATTRLAVRLAGVARDPNTTVENLSWIREFADGRGLLKTPVSPDLSLLDVLTQQKKALTDAAVAASPNAAAMREEAAGSWKEDVAQAQADNAAAQKLAEAPDQ